VEDEEDTGEDAGALSTAAPSLSAPTVGGLSALDSPEAQDAMATLLKSNKAAQAALQQARSKIAARKYNNALALLSVSGALGQPTRSGSFAESFGNAANALTGPLREKSQFEERQGKDLLGIDTQLAGIDQNTAMAQLQLANTKAKIAAELAGKPNELVVMKDANGKPLMDADGKPRVQWASYQRAQGQEGALPGGNNITLKQQQESAEDKYIGEAMGKKYIELQNTGSDAPTKIGKLDRLEDLLTGVNTGKAAPTMATLASLGESLFNIKLDPKLGPKQAAEALTNEMSLEMRSVANGAGMPGSLSDSDREYLKASMPGLMQSGGANKLMFETQRRLRQREMEVAKVARLYRQKNGHLDEGFYDALQNYADTHPLFEKKASAPTAPPEPQQSQPQPQPAQEPGAAEQPDETGSPDDNAPAVEGGAPPEREAYVVAHPEAAQQFFEHYHYLPKDVPYPRVVPRR
jgi:hypothetical protein